MPMSILTDINLHGLEKTMLELTNDATTAQLGGTLSSTSHYFVCLVLL